MKIKFMINSPSCGYQERIVEMQSNVSEEDIKSQFNILFGVDNLFCSYEIIEEGD